MVTHRIITDTRLDRLSYLRQGTESLIIGSTPNEEVCTQAGHHIDDQITECNVYINQLIRMHGTPPEGGEFFIIRNTGHEAGEYYEAAIMYMETTEEQLESDEDSPSELYALDVEMGCDTWDAQAIAELDASDHQSWKIRVLKQAS